MFFCFQDESWLPVIIKHFLSHFVEHELQGYVGKRSLVCATDAPPYAGLARFLRFFKEKLAWRLVVENLVGTHLMVEPGQAVRLKRSFGLA